MREKQAKYNSGKGENALIQQRTRRQQGNAQILLRCLSLGVLLISQLLEVLVESLDLALQILLLRLQQRTQRQGSNNSSERRIGE